jgi:serine/threonine-protein kinase
MKAPPLESKVVHELGKYTLVAELARGGMGIVHLAVAHGPGGFNKLLAVKELKPELAQDQNYVHMFLEEARLAARLTHPNIVQTNEVGSETHRHYMVMEFLDGRSLHRVARRLADRGGLPVAAHLRIVAESLLGLHYAHELRDFDGQQLGIVHRDVSPLNVFVTFDGQTKVIDFGIAKAVDSSLETQTGVLKGRVAYMAPEQAWGAKVDRRADVYSAGVMLWEAAAGRRLWPGMSDVEILTRVLREGAPRLRTVCPEAPDDLQAICERAMAKQAGDRYETAAELLEDLEAHLASRDDQMTMREIGALVSGAFAEERRRMNAAIEETLVRVRTGPRSGVIPTLDARASDTPSRRLAVEDLSQSSTQWFSRASSRAPTGSSVSMPAPTTALAPALAKLVELRRFAPVAAACTGTLLLVVVILASLLRERPPTMPPVVAASPTVLAQPVAREELSPAAAPVRDFVEITVKVSPPSAQIAVDGAVAANNPLLARYPRDGQAHHVMAFADGFEPKWREISFANDVSLEIALERHVAPVAQLPATRRIVTPPPPVVGRSGKAAVVQFSAAPPPEQPSPPQAPAQRAEVNPAGGHSPLRPIQTSNPYGAP